MKNTFCRGLCSAFKDERTKAVKGQTWYKDGMRYCSTCEYWTIIILPLSSSSKEESIIRCECCHRKFRTHSNHFKFRDIRRDKIVVRY